MTLDELAKQAGVSIGILSQLERGKGNPSFATLANIAFALGAPVAALVSAHQGLDPVVRKNNRQSIKNKNDSELDGTREILTADGSTSIEAMLITAPPGYDTSGQPFRGSGEEFGFILSGRHEVYLDGEKYVLEAGDSITFSARIPHWYKNPGPEPVQAVWIITLPKAV